LELTTPPSLVCNEGMKLSADEKTCECKDPFVRVGDRCVPKSESGSTCGETKKLVNGNCVPKEVIQHE